MLQHNQKTMPLSTAEWLNILLDKQLTYDENVDILCTVYHSEQHQSRAGIIGERLGYISKSPHAPINSIVSHHAKRIAKHYRNGLLFSSHENGRTQWWSLFFNGWYQQGTQYFIWQLKPELCHALERSGLLNRDYLPLAEEWSEKQSQALWEGAQKAITVNAYERNPKAREQCIEYHGHCRCHICGFDFEAVYGELGRGYIHVHHIVPLSDIKQCYQINPVTDLIPVCPNCHAMLHRRQPPLTAEELKSLLKLST